MRTSLPLFRYLFDKTTDILIFISSFVKINITTKIILVYSYYLYIIDAIGILLLDLRLITTLIRLTQ